jgi:hypothetical protein
MTAIEGKPQANMLVMILTGFDTGDNSLSF